MKNIKVVLLGLIAGLAMTGCADNGYTECSVVLLDDTKYVATPHTYQTVVKYRCETKFSLSTQKLDEWDYYYAYFFVSYDKKMQEPTFPEYATFRVDKGYGVGNVKLEFDYKIGKYESYNKLFLSKDKQTLKMKTADFNPISASKDKEIQGKTVGSIYLNDAGEIEEDFTTNVSGTFVTSVVSTYTKLEGKDLQYTVIEK